MRYLGLLFALLALPATALANFEQFSSFDETSKATVDHRPMDQILNLINVEDGRKDKVAFSRLQGRVLEYVEAYINYLESVPVSSLNKNEQLAYWLNLHNISVIHVIAANRNGHKKINNFRGTPEKPGSKWAEKTLLVEGQDLSLLDIEQNILAQNWENPLFIYGLYYGVQGSPTIHASAFSGANVQGILETNAERFINSKRNVNVKRRGLELSSLYEWHTEQLFNGDEVAVVNHISQYAEPKLASAIAENPVINKHRYNWRSVAFIPRQVPLEVGGGGGYRGAGS